MSFSFPANERFCVRSTRFEHLKTMRNEANLPSTSNKSSGSNTLLGTNLSARLRVGDGLWELVLTGSIYRQNTVSVKLASVAEAVLSWVFTYTP